jgi:hypothetical protein
MKRDVEKVASTIYRFGLEMKRELIDQVPHPRKGPQNKTDHPIPANSKTLLTCSPKNNSARIFAKHVQNFHPLDPCIEGDTFFVTLADACLHQSGVTMTFKCAATPPPNPYNSREVPE